MSRTFCASLRSRHALGHVTRSILRWNLQEKNTAGQILGLHFVRACALEMHIDMSPAPLYAKFPRKMPHPRHAPHVLCEPAQSKFAWARYQNQFMQKFAGKMRQTKTATSVLSEPPAQWKCTWTNHKSIQEPFDARIYRKKAGSQIEHPDPVPSP